MRSDFTLRQLEVFAGIAQGDNLTHTAEHLGLSQSAASMSLKELETALEGPLFNRISRRLVLNDRGRLLLPKALEILHLANESAELLKSGSVTPKGNVIIGCSSTIASYWIPPLLKGFYAEHPNINISLKSGNTLDIASDLREGCIDFGLVEGPVEFDDIEDSLWVEDELVLIAPKDHPYTLVPEIPLERLVDETWILREQGSGTRTSLEEALRKEGLRLKNKMELGHTEAVKRAVESGLGISCLSRISVCRELDLGYLSEIHLPIQFFRWFRLINVKGQYLSPLLRHTIDILHELSHP